MIFVLKLDPGIVKIYVQTESEVPSFSSSKFVARQTGRPDWNITYPHTRMVKIVLFEFLYRHIVLNTVN